MSQRFVTLPDGTSEMVCLHNSSVHYIYRLLLHMYMVCTVVVFSWLFSMKMVGVEWAEGADLCQWRWCL